VSAADDDFFKPLSSDTTAAATGEDDFFKPLSSGADLPSDATSAPADDFNPFDKPLFEDQ
jgi:hypothetical protein